MTPHTSERIIIVGGGFSGLSIAARLAQSGLPVTLLEASRLGFEASTRNQGWLHSGGSFAPQHPALARMCHASLQQTLAFCPACEEPDHEGMYYIISRADTPVGPWMLAWERAGIPVRLVPREQVGAALPGIDLSAVQHAFLLPDRAIRPQTLLSQLAATARNAGAEIRGDTPVRDLLREGGRVHGVATSAGEEVLGRLVILATGAAAGQAWSHIYTARPGENARYSLVALKTHLVAVQPDVGRMPFYVVDDGGFNHLPHHYTSVFGSNHWHPVQNPSDASVEPRETSRIWQRLGTLFPGHDRDACTSVNEWAGTTVQAMHLEQVVPGEAPLPTVIDHSDASPRYENLLSVFPGRATLWAQLAEQTRRTVLDRLDRRAVETALPPWSVRAAARHA